MVTDLGYKSLSHLLEDIAVKLTLSGRAVISLRGDLLAYLYDHSTFYLRKKAVRIVVPEPTSDMKIPILHDADRRIIDLIRMARNAEVSHFAGHTQGGLLH